MIKRIALLLFLSGCLFAAEKTFIREYTYEASDYDSKVTSRANALEQVKRILLEEVSVFLKSEINMSTTEVSIGGESELKDFYENKITSITAGVTETKIIDESWNGYEYWIKAEITIDEEDIEAKIDDIMQNDEKLKELEELNNIVVGAWAEITNLKEQLSTEKETNQDLIGQYNKQTEMLSAPLYYYKGNYFQAINELDSAEFYYKKASELSLGNSFIINNLGTILLRRGDFEAAHSYFGLAAVSDPDNKMAIANWGNTFRLLGDYEYAEKMLYTSINMGNNHFSPYYNLALVYYETDRFDNAEAIFIDLLNDFEMPNETIEKINNYVKKLTQIKSLD